MTTQSTEADASTTTSTPRPVRVPNVSHGAVSGLGHEVIGGAVHEVYDAEQRVEHTQAGADPASPLGSDPTGGALPTGTDDPDGTYEGVTIPEDVTTVEGLLEWAGDDEARQQAVLVTELAKPDADQRVTLITPLQAALHTGD